MAENCLGVGIGLPVHNDDAKSCAAAAAAVACWLAGGLWWLLCLVGPMYESFVIENQFARDGFRISPPRALYSEVDNLGINSGELVGGKEEEEVEEEEE